MRQTGVDLEHRLHELGGDPRLEFVAGHLGEHRLDVLHEVEGVGVEELVLLLDAERVRVAVAERVLEHAGRRDALEPVIDGGMSCFELDRAAAAEHRVDVDLDLPGGVHQRRDDGGVHRADVPEGLAVCPCGAVEVRRVGHVHARPDDVGEARARLLEGPADDLEAEQRLLVEALGRRRAVGLDSRPSRRRDVVADDQRASSPSGSYPESRDGQALHGD